MSVCCKCCVLSGRGLRDELITRSEESYRLWCVVVCDLETSLMRRACPTSGCCAMKKQTTKIYIFYVMGLISYVFKIYQNMTINSSYCSYYYNCSKRNIHYVFHVRDVNL